MKSFKALLSNRLPLLLLLFTFGITTLSCQSNTDRMEKMPMGTAEDITYAKQLWNTMKVEKLVGSNATKTKPFIGAARPHGWILELLYQNISVGTHTGFIVVKKNYNGSGVSVDTVEADRARYLSSITIMVQREAGYDEDNLNWFWAKYKPDGSLYTKEMKGMKFALAGRIAKGKTPDETSGCIYCHRSAGGGDYIFFPEIKLPGFNAD